MEATGVPGYEICGALLTARDMAAERRGSPALFLAVHIRHLAKSATRPSVSRIGRELKHWIWCARACLAAGHAFEVVDNLEAAIATLVDWRVLRAVQLGRAPCGSQGIWKRRFFSPSLR
jgi:hypothetical protein